MTEREEVLAYCRMVQSVRGRLRPEGWTYTGMEDFLLDRGTFWTAAPLPPNVRQMTPKACFWNALKMAQRHRRTWRYVEGLALGILPVHHAWVVDADGVVIDPTWETPGRAYFGVVFDVDERLVAEGPVLDNWRKGFPVYRWPRLGGSDERTAVRRSGGEPGDGSGTTHCQGAA